MNRQIEIRGARAGGLADVAMRLPLGAITGFVGRSRSGRRAMALEVLYAESRRRYMQALAPVEREGLGGIGQVDVEEVSGLPPAIFLGRGRRGRTVGDYVQIEPLLIQLALDLGQLHCGACGRVCRSYAAAEVENAVGKCFAGGRCLILAPLQLQQGADWPSVWAELRRAGFLRVQVDDSIVRLDQGPKIAADSAEIRVVVDRLRPGQGGSVRFLDAVRTARSIASGLTLVQDVDSGAVLAFNQQPTCTGCGRGYDEMSAQDLAGRDARDRTIALRGRPFGDLRRMPMWELSAFAAENLAGDPAAERLRENLAEVCGLGLGEVGLGRPLGSLSAGEWQRLQLASCLSGGLTGVLYIFDSLGIALDRNRAASVGDGLARLVARGNTVLLLDHNPELLAYADEVWDFVSGRPQRIGASWRPPRADSAQAQRNGGQVETMHIEGDGALGALDIEFRRGALNCLSGPSGGGKTRVLTEVVPAAIKGGKMAYGVSGAGRNNRVVSIGRPGGRETLLVDELGVFAGIADLYAAAPAAQSRGLGRDVFMLDKPGGRCARCEGKGRLFYDMEFLEDISQVCETCGGRRYRDEIAEITLRGIGIADILAMSVARASRHFARVAKVHKRLVAAENCGLGDLLLGLRGGDLEDGEWLRLRLAVEGTRASSRTWVLIDNPAAGDHPQDIEQTIFALRLLLKTGATAIVADQQEAIVAAADHVVEFASGAAGEFR